jgi:hypothetical protein
VFELHVGPSAARGSLLTTTIRLLADDAARPAPA